MMIINFAILLIGVQLASSCQESYGEERPLTLTGYPNIADLMNIYNATMTCKDTADCSLPKCCGICAGCLSAITLNYRSIVEMESGIFTGSFFNATISTPLLTITANSITPVVVPGTVAGYNPNACAGTSCPQPANQNCTFRLPFQFPGLTTSAGAIVNFVGKIETPNPDLVSLPPISLPLLPSLLPPPPKLVMAFGIMAVLLPDC